MVFMALSRTSARPDAMLRLAPNDRTINRMSRLSWFHLDSFTLAIVALCARPVCARRAGGKGSPSLTPDQTCHAGRVVEKASRIE
jgi:hypothetical protein